MLAAMSAINNDDYSEKRKLTDEDKEELKDKAEKKRLDKFQQQGVNKYVYGEHIIWARNQENADKKARKRGYLL